MIQQLMYQVCVSIVCEKEHFVQADAVRQIGIGANTLTNVVIDGNVLRGGGVKDVNRLNQNAFPSGILATGETLVVVIVGDVFRGSGESAVNRKDRVFIRFSHLTLFSLLQLTINHSTRSNKRHCFLSLGWW